MHESEQVAKCLGNDERCEDPQVVLTDLYGTVEILEMSGKEIVGHILHEHVGLDVKEEN